ncbi:MAG: DNA/RNA non-specific endonuclease [Methyloprofundus sp.]|nr:DNA/RNA non-specific endonuclease [Methyloprofundus sp.]
MKLAIFIALSLFTSSIFSASQTKSDVEELLIFIDKLSKSAKQKISPPPFSKYQSATSQVKNLLRLDYEGFTVWLDCARHGAVKFRYNAQHDTGSHKRYGKFFLDPKVPAECQQTTAKAYGQNYDRGHLVPANHLDHSETAIKATNTMTNILPQAANMNRGAWLMTEEITECYRDIDELLIIGGVIWGNNPDDDYFVQSHGVKTPDAFWKVIIRGVGSNQRAIAWIVPNSQEAKRKKLDNYQVSVSEIERVTGEIMPVADYVKYDKANPWVLPRGCDKG